MNIGDNVKVPVRANTLWKVSSINVAPGESYDIAEAPQT
jgi:hypothetical protein